MQHKKCPVQKKKEKIWKLQKDAVISAQTKDTQPSSSVKIITQPHVLQHIKQSGAAPAGMAIPWKHWGKDKKAGNEGFYQPAPGRAAVSCCVICGDVPSPGPAVAAVLGHSPAQPALRLWLLLFAGLEETEWTKVLPKSCDVLFTEQLEEGVRQNTISFTTILFSPLEAGLCNQKGGGI